MSTPLPRRRLPVRPSLENLRKQAKHLVRRESVALAEAQHAIARSYGCRNWPELVRVVEQMNATADQLENVQVAQTPLHVAVNAADLPAIGRLLDAGEYTQLDLDRGLAHACWYDRIGPWPLRRAIAERLLAAGADPNGQYGSAYGPIVLGCCECLAPDGLEFLIDAGADVAFDPIETKYGRASPMLSILNGYEHGRRERRHRCIELLLRHGARHEDDAVLAINRGDVGRLSHLIDAGSAEGGQYAGDAARTPSPTLLHIAAQRGEVECVRLLLNRGADRTTRDDKGRTPVDLARQGGVAEIVALLES